MLSSSQSSSSSSSSSGFVMGVIVDFVWLVFLAVEVELMDCRVKRDAFLIPSFPYFECYIGLRYLGCEASLDPLQISPVIVGGYLKFVVICDSSTVLPCTGLSVACHIRG
ncbi:hypothetical protein AKJ16_DCAP08178 [Drosera capensis]